MSSLAAVKIPVGACTTALQSLEIIEEGSYKFTMGRELNEMSRPTASTHDGFMEAQGCGAQVVMSTKTAIELGATIRGIVTFTPPHPLTKLDDPSPCPAKAFS